MSTPGIAARDLTYGSVCSGIEAASVAWHPLGWRGSFLSEIDAFPRAVLQHHYPEVPIHGDFTSIEAGQYEPIDLLVGGTPCQSFSVAGLRGGLGDDRGNLALEYLRLADRLKPRWLVWENVPGVLSSAGGRDFGAILGGLVELGYGFAYRVLDAQYVRVDGFGRAVPQRRRRVFVVGYLGDWRRAAAVLFERESLHGHTPPSRKAGQGSSYDVAPCIAASGRGFDRTGDTRGQDCLVPEVCGALLPEIAMCLNAGAMGRIDGESETFLPVAFDCKGTEVQWADDGSHPTLRSMGHNTSHANAGGHAAVAIQERAVSENLEAGPGGSGISTAGAAYTLEARNKVQAVAFQSSQSGVRIDDVHATLDSNNGSRRHNGVVQGWRVRRLTPTECERLQGVPDGYTNIPWRGKPHSPDGPRYKALGNSMAVNVMRWIGQRIAMVDAIAAREPQP